MMSRHFAGAVSVWMVMIPGLPAAAQAPDDRPDVIAALQGEAAEARAMVDRELGRPLPLEPEPGLAAEGFELLEE